MYKVIFFAKGFPTAEDSMKGNYEAAQARAIARNGNHVSYLQITSMRSLLHIFTKHPISRRVCDGITVYEKDCVLPCLPYLPKSRKLNDWAEKRAYDKLYRRYVQENGKPDICHVHIVLCCKGAAYIKERYNIPFVITEHWSAVLEPTIEDDVRQLGIDFYPKADSIIGVSQALSNRITEQFNVDTVVINNMVEDVFFQGSTHQKNIDGKFHFIAVGRLCDHKHFDMLIEAFANAGFSSDTVLDIVGEGETRQQLQWLITEKKLDSCVTLHGVKSSEEVSEMLTSSDCYVLSSRLETFGIVLLEAMAKGLPIISTKCGGPESFIGKEQGVLVPNNDCQALTDALVWMRNNADGYDSGAIRKYCHENFNSEKISLKIQDVYNKVLN